MITGCQNVTILLLLYQKPFVLKLSCLEIGTFFITLLVFTGLFEKKRKKERKKAGPFDSLLLLYAEPILNMLLLLFFFFNYATTIHTNIMVIFY